MIPAQISGEALDSLLGVLGRVSSNGGRLDGDAIWFTSKEMASGCHTTPSHIFEEEKNVLQTHKQTLLQLRKSLEIRMSEVEKAINSHSRVFIFAVGQHACFALANEPSISISHVCRRFRSISIQIPELWTVLICSHSVAETTEFLERSGSMPLIVVCDENFSPKLKEFLDVVLPDNLRWEELWICGDIDSLTDIHQTAISLCSYHPRLELPNLTTLRQAVYQATTGTISNPFLKTPWHMPRLSNFISLNATPSSDGDRFHLLTHCELRWDYIHAKEFPALIRCLSVAEETGIKCTNCPVFQSSN
ncbi:hypothetical protein BD410DRAFT_433656 [Rickenella mellea]|uniref:F-box domain-containing protein n=1 Tax=Rickenella mellea TaxID=50990 RepID=A0A4Y7PYC0_9AGAM|nr:hypothetical protein BD410DRAFT_433656 [Rickenella mellea]